MERRLISGHSPFEGLAENVGVDGSTVHSWEDKILVVIAGSELASMTFDDAGVQACDGSGPGHPAYAS